MRRAAKAGIASAPGEEISVLRQELAPTATADGWRRVSSLRRASRAAVTRQSCSAACGGSRDVDLTALWMKSVSGDDVNGSYGLQSTARQVQGPEIYSGPIGFGRHQRTVSSAARRAGGLLRSILVKEEAMATSRPFRFGVLALEAVSSSSRDAWVSYARKVEDIGYSTLVMGEHISFGGLAPFPALMAAADATTRLRVATHVLVNDFRNPVLLAQEVATLDLLAEGRFEFGIGAGWLAADYPAAGIMFARRPPACDGWKKRCRC